MVDDDTGIVVVDPSALESFGEWYAETSAENQDSITKCQRPSVSREHSRESKVKGVSTGLITSNVRSDGEEEDGYPE